MAPLIYHCHSPPTRGECHRSGRWGETSAGPSAVSPHSPRPGKQLGRGRQPQAWKRERPQKLGEHTGATRDWAVAAAGLGPHTQPHGPTGLGRGPGRGLCPPSSTSQKQSSGHCLQKPKRIKLTLERLAMRGVGCLPTGGVRGGGVWRVSAFCQHDFPAQLRKTSPILSENHDAKPRRVKQS